MFTSIRNGAFLALAVGALTFQTPAHAVAFAEASPVSTQTLDHIRGGFSMEFNFGQLMMALSMSQVSMINGAVVPGEQAATSGGGGSTLIQQGPNNSINPSVLNNIPAGSLSTVIQNSLNDQVIRSVSTLNITITSQMLAQSMALQSLNQAALLRFLH
ncbi:MAG: hypothetical protein WBF69_04185 [Castellaniella sp.]|uniref:hypothetical protein n=1 Tax=Castellaniella sp. TaxID=1955812 RepID=UPI003C735E2A